MNKQEQDIADRSTGKKLREARELAKLSREEVAERLRLNVKVIEALENDNYSSMPGLTYVQGYLRSYGKLLDLPEENIVLSNQSPDFLPDSKIDDDETELKQYSRKSLLVAVIVGLVVLLILSSITNDSDEEIVQSVSIASQPDIVVPAEFEEKNNLTEEPIESSNKIQAADKKNMPEISPAREFKGLEIHYLNNSWTEVYDISGERLVYGKIKKGELLKVDGKQPLTVLIGDSEAVSIRFNSKKFEHERFTRNGVARFVIGSSLNN